jgi:methyl-accepting chemotaxis protein
MPNLDHETIELLFIAVTALCIVFQTILLAAFFFGARKGIKGLTEQVDDLRSSVMPIIAHTRGFIERITPRVEETAKRVEETAKNVAEMSQTIKANTAKVSNSANEIVERVNAQTSRVDGMVSTALDAIDSAAGFVAETVNKPVRQLSGLLASVKAIVESLGASQAPRRGRQAAPHSTSKYASGPADEAEPDSEQVL